MKEEESGRNIHQQEVEYNSHCTGQRCGERASSATVLTCQMHSTHILQRKIQHPYVLYSQLPGSRTEHRRRQPAFSSPPALRSHWMMIPGRQFLPSDCMSFMYTLSSHTHILTYSYTTEYKAFSYLATQTYLLKSFLVRHKHGAVNKSSCVPAW